MKFTDYNIAPEIKWNLENLNFNRPTDIQYKAIPPILKGEDVLAIAQTGTGKTAAFAIPVINILHDSKSSKRTEGIKCIVMAPTRELALQITEVFSELCKHTRVNTFCVHGGVEQDSQIAQLEKGIDILVATPGRMFDLVSQKYIHLNTVEILILDEADHMLDLGFINDIRDVIRHIPRKHQTLFFSATINENIKKLAYSLVENPIRIQISPKDPVSKNVTHSVAFIEMDDKRFFLERIIKENPDTKILIFVRTKVRAERVQKAMERVGIVCFTIHGDKEQKDRTSIMKQFKEGIVKILIATDVSARGIDVAKVQYIINYDLPDKAENYVHRVGRTGRGTEKGIAISFCSEEEKPMLEEIEGFVTKKINVMEISKSEYNETLVYAKEEDETDWKSLIEEDETSSQYKKKKKSKK
ncbi:MAG TPA: ATP-dependent helicase [Bacteroidales bacterium]|nr:MAG: RNA helicase [Bacteroidetes bacterium GWF2_33_38]OFY75179.1 MAG: RNA helicase [Bacteroidetes bacterium RIFOXYA12_FULL_33_9]HBF88971.1 ATP-dependent helicase [Bacteroidales bacterium]